MKFLILDTSSEILSLALSNQGRVSDINLHRDIDQDITAVIEAFLGINNLRLGELDYLCIGLGPGSFTGLRIGCSIIKGLALGLGKPIVSFSSFYSIAYQSILTGSDIAVVKDARRDLVYAGVYKTNKKGKLLQAKLRLADLRSFLADLKKTAKKRVVFSGESFKFASTIKKFFPQAEIFPLTYPLARFMIEEAERRIKNRRITLPDKLEPLYLYRSDCQVRRRAK